MNHIKIMSHTNIIQLVYERIVDVSCFIVAFKWCLQTYVYLPESPVKTIPCTDTGCLQVNISRNTQTDIYQLLGKDFSCQFIMNVHSYHPFFCLLINCKRRHILTVQYAFQKEMVLGMIINIKNSSPVFSDMLNTCSAYELTVFNI